MINRMDCDRSDFDNIIFIREGVKNIQILVFKGGDGPLSVISIKFLTVFRESMFSSTNLGGGMKQILYDMGPLTLVSWPL